MDIIFIKELCVETVIGIYDWERKIKQMICIPCGWWVTDEQRESVKGLFLPISEVLELPESKLDASRSS